MGTKHKRDYRLVQFVFRGDLCAWEELYNDSYRKVYGYIRKQCCQEFLDGGTCEDIVNEAYGEGYRCLCQFRGESKFSTWICAIARNIMRNYMRRFQRKCELFERVYSQYSGSEINNPEHVVIWNEICFCIWSSYRSLPEKYRLLVRYIVLMEINRKVVARQIGLSVSECDRVYRAAIRKMKKEFIYTYYGRDSGSG